MTSLKFVNMLQLESYQAPMYLKWLKRNTFKDWLPLVLAFLVCFFAESALPFAIDVSNSSNNIVSYLQFGIMVIYIVLMGNIIYIWRKQPLKKPLVYTDRIKRLLAAIILLITFIVVAPLEVNNSIMIYILARTKTYLPALCMPFVILLAYFITYPIEEGIKRGFLMQAKKKLKARDDLIKIAITGSYGKTSTKYALGQILSAKFKTCITPQSYNTPMGVTRVIRETLDEKDEVFVAEMGARYVGDIDELCDLVAPKIGILTSVGKQHLETFGSEENIASTKYELIEALPADGAAFFNADNDICLELSKHKSNVKEKYLYGIDTKAEVFMRAIDIKASAQGSTFTLIADDGNSVFCCTKLLGRHNILNITGCAAVAYYLGLKMEQIASAIANLESVEHRLQLINSGPVTVIDDGFNSNPQGAKAALEVLRSFDGRKIIVTPGMVELGKEEFEQNKDFGREIACSVDYAILVGKKRSIPIAQGMAEYDFPKDNIFVVASLDEATTKLSTLTVPGDVVLIENDLPDNYNE